MFPFARCRRRGFAGVIRMRAKRPYYTRIDAIFAFIFCERYIYIAYAVKVSCAACKCPLRANGGIFAPPENWIGAHWGVSPVLADQARAAKNLKFCKFFILNELPTFLGYIFLKFFLL